RRLARPLPRGDDIVRLIPPTPPLSAARARNQASELRDPLAARGVSDEPFEPAHPRLLPFRADDPPSGGLSVGRGLLVEELRGGRVLFQHRSIRLLETVAALLVGVDPVAVLLTGGEGLSPRRPHPAFSFQRFRARGVHHAPDAPRPPRRETDRVAFVAEAAADAVDPADAQRLVHRLRPGDALLIASLLVIADQELRLPLVVLLEPPPELRGRRKEPRLHRMELYASGDRRREGARPSPTTRGMIRRDSGGSLSAGRV